MRSLIPASLLAALVLLAACEGNGVTDLTRDFGIDGKPVSQLQAGIWVDPNGCEHWIIDDGIEGYMSQRLQPDGKPVCGNASAAGTILQDYRRGSDVPDVF